MRYAFITSTGRTGTEFFSYLFSEIIENSWSLHEPKPAFCRRSYAFLSKEPGWYDHLYFGTSRKLYNLGKHKDWYVEPNHHLFNALPMIRKVFPGSPCIHLIRDGRQVVRSWLNRYKYMRVDMFTAFHVPNDPAQKLWHQWNPVQKIAWYWKTVNRVSASQHPELTLRFEDIFISDDSAIFKLLDTIPGLEYDEQRVQKALGHRVNTSRQDFFPKFEEWPQQWQQQFWEIAGEDMIAHGYIDAIPEY